MKIIQNLNQKQNPVPKPDPSDLARPAPHRPSPPSYPNRDQSPSSTLDLDPSSLPSPNPKPISDVSKKLFKDSRLPLHPPSQPTKHQPLHQPHHKPQPQHPTPKDRAKSIVRDNSDPIAPKKKYNLKEKTDLIKLKDKIERRLHMLTYKDNKDRKKEINDKFLRNQQKISGDKSRVCSKTVERNNAWEFEQPWGERNSRSLG